MRICFVSREIAGVRGGGIGTYVAEAARALGARGHEVWLVIEDPPAGLEVPGVARIVPVAAAPDRASFFFGWPHYEHAYAVHETLQRCGVTFDYVEFADYQAEGAVALREQRLLASYGADTVLAVTLHTPAYECYLFNRQLHRATESDRTVFALEDEMLRDAEHWNAPSSALRDRLAARLGRDPNRVPLLRYPLELPTATAKASEATRIDALEFVYFGRCEPRKGVEELVAAFARMPDLRLRLIGADTPFSPYGGSLRAWLERRCPANVSFEGAMPRAELWRELARPEVVCILPSRFENWPNACLEAMALGKVVLGGKCGGMAEMIEHGVSGFLLDGEDASDIERVVRVELGDALGRLAGIGAAAAARARQLADPGRYVDTLVRLIEARRAAQRERAARRTARPRTAPLVSIVIPFYKDRDTIDAAVDSALAQSHERLEVVLVDDGSPLDDAASILARLAARDPRVRVLRKQNGGLSSARNFGIEHASGEYLLFLDADNSLRPEYARLAVEALERCPELMFIAPHAHFFQAHDGSTFGIYNPLPYSREFALIMNRFGDAGACFRGAVFRDHGLRYDESLISFEDWALWIDLDRRALRGSSIPRVCYDYRMRADSMMQADAWPNFRALIGLLIDRHFACETSDANAPLLWTLNQTWGRDASEWQRAREERGAWPRRYWFVDKVYGALCKVPLLRKLIRARTAASRRPRRD